MARAKVKVKVIINEPDITPEENAKAIQNSVDALTRLLKGANLIADDEYVDNPWKDRRIEEGYVPKTHVYHFEY